MTPAGDFDKRVILQSNSVTTNGAGEQTTTWASIGPIFASIKPVSARERIQNGSEIDQEGQFTIRVRRSSLTTGISTAWRVLYGSRVFQIAAVINPDERNEEWHLIASETT
jgi:SPP1 family predicted phage head-tail adaptor